MTYTAEQYRSNELRTFYKYLDARRHVDRYSHDDVMPSVDVSIDRITWLLDGSYGAGAKLYAENLISAALHGKKGKNIDKAWLAIGRELIILVALLDTTESNVERITRHWKKLGVDFPAINARTAAITRAWLEEQTTEG